MQWLQNTKKWSKIKLIMQYKYIGSYIMHVMLVQRIIVHSLDFIGYIEENKHSIAMSQYVAMLANTYAMSIYKQIRIYHCNSKTVPLLS